VSNSGGVEVGLFFPGTNLSQIDTCSEPHEGQTNITILPIKSGMRGLLLGDFGFLSGGVAGGGAGAAGAAERDRPGRAPRSAGGSLERPTAAPPPRRTRAASCCARTRTVATAGLRRSSARRRNSSRTSMIGVADA
jgi:hypothetical protein